MARFPGTSSVVATIARSALIVMLGAVVAGCAAISSSSDQPQRQAVAQFYEAALAMDVLGLPDDEQMARLAKLISPDLLDQLNHARAQQALDFSRHQGSEPPLVQGALFFSLFEGAQEVIAIKPADQPLTWVVTLGYGHGADAFEWTDIARVVQVNGRWMVQDIEFMGQWDFARSGWLIDALLSVQAQTTP